MDKRIERLIDMIQSGQLNQRQLDNLYDNASSYVGIEEVDREHLLEEIMTALRVRFPAAAKRRFGAKDQFARALLTPVFEESQRQFDLSTNRVLNKVKTGGDMLSGRAHVDVYVSYKNQDSRRLSLDIRQETPDRAPIARLMDLIVGTATVETREYPLDQFSLAGAAYLDRLGTMVKRLDV